MLSTLVSRSSGKGSTSGLGPVPVPRKPRKLFGPVKLQQNLEPYDYRAVLFTYS